MRCGSFQPLVPRSQGLLAKTQRTDAWSLLQSVNIRCGVADAIRSRHRQQIGIIAAGFPLNLLCMEGLRQTQKVLRLHAD